MKKYISPSINANYFRECILDYLTEVHHYTKSELTFWTFVDSLTFENGMISRECIVFKELTDSIDLSTVINHPDKKIAKQILSNVKKWQSGGFVTVKDGVATITQNGKAVLASAGFKAASVPLTEGTVAAVGNVPGAVIVATKKVVTAVAKAVQTAATQKR